MILIYTGNGKGKTSAAIGTAIRSLGYNRKILFVQFFKAQFSGEINVLKDLNVDLLRDGTLEFVNKKNLEENKVKARRLLEIVQNKHNEKEYDLIVLDEFTYLINFEILNSSDAISFLRKLISVKDCDIIITGRNAHDELIEIADLVTEMKEIKHPFKKGVPAKEGIDF
ncbi:MAG: cob(I)yrinic acid a,c-diamide adenosyltransferase [Candidatus Woesearchaeota archaeon]